MGTTALTATFGFFYWLLAARNFSPEAVGFASAAISAMMLMGTVGVLGFGTLLIGELPRQQDKKKALISTALITAGGAGGILGILFAVMSPRISPDLRALSESFANITLFSFGICLTAIALVLDQALIGLLRGSLQFWRNVIMAVVKLGALLVVGLWFSNRSGLSIYATWVFGNLVSLIIIAVLAFSKSWHLRAFLPHWGLLRNHGLSALRHHALNLALQVTGLMLPILVTALLSVRMNAYFYTAWMIANLAFVIPVALTTVLYAVVSADPTSLIQKTRLTLKLSFLVGLLAVGVLMAGSSLVLNFFGASYAQEAAWSLRLLSLSVFPVIIRTHYVAIYRILNRVSQTAKVMAICAIFELALAALGGKIGGLAGLCLGWTVAHYVEAAFMLRTVHRTTSLQEMSEWQTLRKDNLPMAN